MNNTIELTSKTFGTLTATIVEVKRDGRISISAQIAGQTLIGSYAGQGHSEFFVTFHPTMNPNWEQQIDAVVGEISDAKLRKIARRRFQIEISDGLNELNALSAEATREQRAENAWAEKILSENGFYATAQSEWEDDQKFSASLHPVHGVELLHESERASSDA